MYLGGFLQPSPETLIVRARDAKHVGESKRKYKKKKEKKKNLANFSNREITNKPRKDTSEQNV